MSKNMNPSNPMGWVFFLSIIGAAVYYVQQYSGFWGDIGGVLKAFVWPAFVTYEVFQRMKF